MPLNHEYQMQLLRDILSNHQVDCCGSVAECEQLERLVKSLMVNTNINENIKPVLEEIYRYGQLGTYTQNLDEHITAHQQDLSSWVSSVNQYT